MNKHRNDTADMVFILLMLCLFIYILLSVSSCSAPRETLTGRRDSIQTKFSERIIYRDTTIYVPIPVEHDNSAMLDTDTSRLRTSLAESEAFVYGGKLHHTLRNLHEALVPIYLKLPERILQTEHTHLAARTVTVEVERKLTHWQQLFLTLGQGTFVAALAVIAYLFIRIIRKLT